MKLPCQEDCRADLSPEERAAHLAACELAEKVLDLERVWDRECPELRAAIATKRKWVDGEVGWHALSAIWESGLLNYDPEPRVNQLRSVVMSATRWWCAADTLEGTRQRVREF